MSPIYLRIYLLICCSHGLCIQPAVQFSLYRLNWLEVDAYYLNQPRDVKNWVSKRGLPAGNAYKKYVAADLNARKENPRANQA